MTFDDQIVINKLSNYFAEIDGITKSFAFAENPDNIAPGILPCAMFYIPSFKNKPAAHRNRWTSEMLVRAVLFVAPRESRGGRLKFLENDAIPFGGKVRRKFQTASVIEDLLTLSGSDGGMTKVFLTGGQYGAGQRELIHNSVQYIGWLFDFVFSHTT